MTTGVGSPAGDGGLAATAVPAEDEPYAAALAGLPGAGPVSLGAVLRDWTPGEAWRRIRSGRLAGPGSTRRGQGPPRLWPALEDDPDHPDLGPRDGPGPLDVSWQRLAGRVDPPAWWAHYAAQGIRVSWPGHAEYPAALADDPERPAVLFWRGSIGHLNRPCVALVGTRRATPDGRAVAFELGRDLAAVGVAVVSGLALGIDGAAHRGALSAAATHGDGPRDSPGRAGPVGVAASGVDVPYPRRHADLWEQVVRSGVLLSETPPGRPAQAWRFPARNRIIAGLAQMVVVVESHAAGGSLITAEAAIARGIDVRAVPGPVHSPASQGTNQLLYDGPGPVRSARDVLDGLGIFLSGPADRPPAEAVPVPETVRPGYGPSDRQLDGAALLVLAAVGWRPTSLNQVVGRSGLSVVVVSRSLDALEVGGSVTREGEWWVRRSGRQPGSTRR